MGLLLLLLLHDMLSRSKSSRWYLVQIRSLMLAQHAQNLDVGAIHNNLVESCKIFSMIFSCYFRRPNAFIYEFDAGCVYLPDR